MCFNYVKKKTVDQIKTIRHFHVYFLKILSNRIISLTIHTYICNGGMYERE